MSDALDYLLKARPQTMGHYFRFVAEAGKHLDPKTRALISVITKVHAQTEAGFRQYLRRALRIGASPNEVLDALLMAFPALGLTKIVWAIDVLLKMDLPEFRLQAIAASPAWHRIGACAEFGNSTTARVQCDGKALFVHATGQEIKVFDALCPHKGTEIPASGQTETELRCPGHGWVFDSRNGRCLKGGGTPLTQMPSKVEDGDLYAFW
jgi:nitrite reductase/ring-hydroxylating ferredoxin subunit/alkylhydroperoxidase/carboxymuconolactone decarboxylase family protein YurZ